jgi:predicted dehydrogenase
MVGCGMIGQIHADGLAKLVAEGEVRAVAAADPSADAREAASRNCRFERLVDDGRSVIDDPAVEAVLITAPTAHHRALVLATVAAGKPLLCEKPLAPSFPAVEEMVDAVERAGVTAQVGFHSRFHPLFHWLRDVIDEGTLGAPMGYVLRDDQFWPTGDVVAGHSSWRSDVTQAGGGALLEHSIHSADILCWLFGPAHRVFAVSRNVFGYTVEDTAALTVTHRTGVIGTLLTIFNGVRGREERRFEVFFERGSVELTSDFIVGAPEDSLLVQRPDETPDHPHLQLLRDAYFGSLGVRRRDFLFYQYLADRAWVRSVRAGVPAIPGFDCALTAHALVEAGYRSASTTQPVEL